MRDLETALEIFMRPYPKSGVTGVTGVTKERRTRQNNDLVESTEVTLGTLGGVTGVTKGNTLNPAPEGVTCKVLPIKPCNNKWIRQQVTPVTPVTPKNEATSKNSGSSLIDLACERWRRRVAAKEAELARRGLGADGVTPLAEYRRLEAEGAADWEGK